MVDATDAKDSDMHHLRAVQAAGWTLRIAADCSACGSRDMWPAVMVHLRRGAYNFLARSLADTVGIVENGTVHASSGQA